jgi:hypothetical protein
LNAVPVIFRFSGWRSVHYARGIGYPDGGGWLRRYGQRRP